MLMALVNPALQPCDIFERHKTVVVLRVAAIDEEAHTLTLDSPRCIKGAFEAKQVTMTADGDEAVNAFQTLIAAGQPVVAFMDKTSGRGADQITFYASDGHWCLARRESPQKWTWVEDFDPLGDKSMFGVFNGHPQRLSELVGDIAAGGGFFPAVPFEQFEDDAVIAKASASGLALWDLDGDGRLDVVVASRDGDRILMQTGPMKFEDRTEAMGLKGSASASIGVADVNCDGAADLLLGGVLWLADGKGHFARSDRLPAAAAEAAITASFVDINRDGWPDVLVSRQGKGLAVHLHGGKADAPYRDATKELGLLETPQCVNGDGHVMAGDFTGDGRADLFYSCGAGVLLVQSGSGTFVPGASRLKFDFTISDGSTNRTGGGCMAPLWRPDTTDMAFASYAAMNLVSCIGGKPTDITPWANEITESDLGMTNVLAADLNADGYVDLYVVNGGGFANLLYVNRGYGSFMTPHKYKADSFPASSHKKGAAAAVAGDVDGDGAIDLVLAAGDGRICIMRNATLAGRGKSPKPTRQQKVLDEVSILTVRLQGPLGVSGASLKLKDSTGATVAVYTVGGGDMPGCCSAPVANLAVRQTGKYTLAATFSDGLEQVQPIELAKPASHDTIVVSRRGATSQPTTAEATKPSTSMVAAAMLQAAAVAATPQSASAPTSAPASEPAIAASAHDPRYDDRTIWPAWVTRTSFIKQSWPKARVLVWATPGQSTRGLDLSEPSCWLENGKPAATGPDENTDIVFPASAARYQVAGGEGCFARHMTVEGGAAVGLRYITLTGNLWIKRGGSFSALVIIGDNDTFMRNDDPQPDMVANKIAFKKAPGKSTEWIGNWKLGDELDLFSGRFIIGEGSTFLAGDRSTQHIYPDGQLVLLSGSTFQKRGNQYWGDDVIVAGELLAGTPQRPLTEDATLALSSKVKNPAARQSQADDRGLIVLKEGKLTVTSGEPSAARLVFQLNKLPAASFKLAPELEKTLPPGFDMVLLGQVSLNGVEFNGVLAKGIMMPDISAARQWKNVSLGENQAKTLDGLLAPFQGAAELGMRHENLRKLPPSMVPATQPRPAKGAKAAAKK
jgi:hypothetical protein